VSGVIAARGNRLVNTVCINGVRPRGECEALTSVLWLTSVQKARTQIRSGLLVVCSQGDSLGSSELSKYRVILSRTETLPWLLEKMCSYTNGQCNKLRGNKQETTRAQNMVPFV
jgi:hypothetical protein